MLLVVKDYTHKCPYQWLEIISDIVVWSEFKIASEMQFVKAEGWSKCNKFTQRTDVSGNRNFNRKQTTFLCSLVKLHDLSKVSDVKSIKLAYKPNTPSTYQNQMI